MKLQAVGILALWATSAVVPAAPPEKELPKAVERFEKAISDAERNLRGSIDKVIAKTKDKATIAKIAYEYGRFDKSREVPSIVPTKDYIRARDSAIAALGSQFEPAIKARRAAKETVAADKLELEYAKLVKGARGFGLAVPNPANLPFVVIRNKDGEVLEPIDPKKGGSLIAVTKHVPGRQSQAWRLERGEDGFAFRNAAGGLYLHVPASSQTEGERMILWTSGDNPPNKHFCWKADEHLREVLLDSCFNELTLTVKEINEKGVVRNLLVQEKKIENNSFSQVWKLEIQK